MKIGRDLSKQSLKQTDQALYIDEAGVDNRLYREYGTGAKRRENLCIAGTGSKVGSDL